MTEHTHTPSSKPFSPFVVIQMNSLSILLSILPGHTGPIFDAHLPLKRVATSKGLTSTSLLTLSLSLPIAIFVVGANMKYVRQS